MINAQILIEALAPKTYYQINKTLHAYSRKMKLADETNLCTYSQAAIILWKELLVLCTYKVRSIGIVLFQS